MIKLVVGLGNPGDEYKNTRHNAGHNLLDKLALQLNGNWSISRQFQAHIAEVSCFDDKVIFLKPMAYMNNSGVSVGAVMKYYKLKPEQVLVVHDELELSKSIAKLKKGGGHAGHNGLRDIIAKIDSREFYRLRLGIGRPIEGANIANYVLSAFSQEDKKSFDSVCEKILAEFVLLFKVEMDVFNNLFLSVK